MEIVPEETPASVQAQFSEEWKMVKEADADLLKYYKSRIEAFTKEHDEYAKRLRQFDCSVRDYHKLRWQVAKQKEHISELQKALSDAHVYLYNERQQVLKLAAENDDFKVQEWEDHKRIQHLLALLHPTSQEVTFVRDCRPVAVSRQYPVTDVKKPAAPKRRARPAGASAHNQARQAVDDLLTAVGQHGNVSRAVAETRIKGLSDGSGVATAGSTSTNTSTSTNANASGGSQGATVSSEGKRTRSSSASAARRTTASSRAKSRQPGAQRAIRGSMRRRAAPGGGGGAGVVSTGSGTLRTIYLPNESIDVLKMIIHTLRTQLDEQIALGEQRCKALLEDRVIRETEYKEREASNQQLVRELQGEVERLSNLHQQTTKDYLLLRHESQKREAELRESLHGMAIRKRDLMARALDISSKSARQEKKMVRDAEELVHWFRSQTLTSEEDLNIIKSQFLATQRIYEERIAHLEQQVTVYKGKSGELKRRRRLDSQGFRNDVNRMREQVQGLESLVQQIGVAVGVAPARRAPQAPAFENILRNEHYHPFRTTTEPEPSDPGVAPQQLPARLLMAQSRMQRLQGELSDISRRIDRSEELGVEAAAAVVDENEGKQHS